MSAATMDKPKTEGNGALTTEKLSPFEKTKTWLQSEAFQNAVGKALPKHMTADRFLRIALTAVMKTPKLAVCTQESIFNCLLQLSQFGLEPDGRNAHLIPFDVKKKRGDDWVVDHTDCTLVIDFKGYVDLIMRTGLVANIHADVVCENDDFVYDRGQITKHLIDFKKPRGKAYAAYAVIRFKDGTEKCEVMPAEDILAIRDRSQGWIAFKKGWAKQSPWNPAEPVIEREMWKKTVFRRVTKWVQLSSELRDAITKEDDEHVRLLDLQDPKTIETTARTKTDALADLMRQRQQDGDTEDQTEGAPTGEESQETPEDNAQDGTGATGEESQEQSTPAGESLAAEVAKKISSAIKIASDEPTMDNLVNEIDHLKDEQICADLHKQLAERRQQLSALKARSGNKKSGTLPGT